MQIPDDGPIPFDINEPNGFYTLDLSIPYDRMIATSLQELAYTQGGECWRGKRANEPHHPSTTTLLNQTTYETRRRGKAERRVF